ncbi:MAG: response regulator transcription factor [Acidobacteria bacterium]|nr:response regulator transcription factor [Acidobacteriota bacterium]
MDSLIRIVLADDHPVVRKGLKFSIEQDEGLKVVAEAGDGETALALVKKHRPQVLVLDIDMPKLDGLAAAREMRRQGLDAKIIFLTLHDEQDFFRAAIDLGGLGYILKDSAMVEIVACIHSVADGRPYYSSALTAPMIQPREAPPATPADSLTSRLTPTERKILKLIAVGKSSKEIGAELSIHYRTVENHRTNMCRKLCIEGEGPNALLRFALQNRSSL